MKRLYAVVIGLGLIAAPAFAQSADKATSPTTAEKQRTDGNSPTTTGSGNAGVTAQKQKTDGESPTQVGPGSGAFKDMKKN